MPPTPSTKIQVNSHVTFTFSMQTAAGEALESSEAEEPVEYVHGYQSIVPGLEAGMTGLSAGEKKDFIVQPADAFGDRDDELILEIPRAEVPNDEIAVGDELVAEGPDGDEIPMRITDVRDDVVVVDANHPLAGVALKFSVHVLAVRDATFDEVTEAAQEAEDAAAHEEGDDDEDHVHGPDCGHPDETSGVIQLRRKS